MELLFTILIIAFGLLNIYIVVLGIIKLRTLPKEEKTKRSIWIFAIIICSIISLTFIAAFIFVMIIIYNLAVHGM